MPLSLRILSQGLVEEPSDSPPTMFSMEQHPLSFAGQFPPPSTSASAPNDNITTTPAAEDPSLLSRLSDTWRFNTDLRSVCRKDGLQAALDMMDVSIALEGLRMTEGDRVVTKEWMASLRASQDLENGLIA